MAAEPRIERTASRYDLYLGDDHIGELDFADRDGVRAMHHTGVRAQHEGNGYAALLARRALDDALDDGVKVAPLCWYVAGYIERHPEYAGLVEGV